MNIAPRWGGQSSFINLIFDWTVSRDIAHNPIIWGGKLLEEIYSEYQKKMDLVNRVFMEVLIEGDGGKAFYLFYPYL